MVERMRLTEQYYMLTKCGLTPVRGKKYTEDYAITYNHEKNLYNVTHIKSGTCISTEGFKKLKDCISAADGLIENAENFIAKKPDHIQKHIENYNYCKEHNLIN